MHVSFAGYADAEFTGVTSVEFRGNAGNDRLSVRERSVTTGRERL